MRLTSFPLCHRSRVVAAVCFVLGSSACGAAVESEPAPELDPPPETRVVDGHLDLPRTDAAPTVDPGFGPDPQGYALVGACSYRCLDGCAHPGIVVGERLDSDEPFVPVGMTEAQAFVASGYICAAFLPLGTPVHIEARPQPGFRFVQWLTSDNRELRWNRCPCDGDQDPACDFTVSERTYCGAVYVRLPR